MANNVAAFRHLMGHSKIHFPLVEAGQWCIGDFHLAAEPKLELMEGVLRADVGDGSGRHTQNEGRTPQEEMRSILQEEEEAYRTVLAEQGLPPTTTKYPEATSREEAHQLVEEIHVGQKLIWDGAPGCLETALSKGILGASEVHVASVPESDPQVFNNTLLFCLEEDVGFGVVWAPNWGSIWFRTWKMRVQEALERGKSIIVLTKDDGMVTFQQSIEVAYLREKKIKFKHMRAKNFLLQGRPLVQAALYHRDAIVTEVLEGNHNHPPERYLQQQTYSGNTALHVFAGRGQQRFMEMTITAGSDLERKNFQGATALLISSQQGHEAVAKRLLAANADANATMFDGSTILHIASNYGREKAIKSFLDGGMNVDAPKHNGATPLSLASQRGHESALAVLLHAKAAVDAAGEGGATPLHMACLKGHDVIMDKLLQARASLDATQTDGSTLLHAASLGGHESMVRRILAVRAKVDAVAADGSTALHTAGHAGHAGIAQLLLESRAALDAATKEGNTPLGLASAQGHSCLLRFLDNDGAVLSC